MAVIDCPIQGIDKPCGRVGQLIDPLQEGTLFPHKFVMLKGGPEKGRERREEEKSHKMYVATYRIS